MSAFEASASSFNPFTPKLRIVSGADLLNIGEITDKFYPFCPVSTLWG